MCASVRRASRVLSQIYDDAMRPFGLRMTQASILQALSLTGEKLQGDIAALLALDSTTLTRSIGILRKRGWIRRRKGADRRENWLSISKSGEAELARIQPAWTAVQKQVRSTLGEARWNSLVHLSTEVADLPI
jgi:DNA-binding MarR family transcriptional regulator